MVKFIRYMKLYNRFFPYFLIIFVTVISTLILWSPFLFRQTSWFGLNIKESNFQYIYRHFDGPLYIIPAKTFYNFNHINPSEAGLINSLPSGEKYFAAHLPLYPLLIRVVKEFSIFGGYLKSMLIVNLLSTIALSLFFYYLLKKLKISNKPLILILAFLFLPRFLVVRSIGAPESLFMLLILFSVFFFEKENYLLAGLAGGLAAATKTPGVLLFFAYLFCIAEKYIKTKRFKIGRASCRERV